jgi:hypothetical protein
LEIKHNTQLKPDCGQHLGFVGWFIWRSFPNQQRDNIRVIQKGINHSQVWNKENEMFKEDLDDCKQSNKSDLKITQKASMDPKPQKNSRIILDV